MHDSTPIPGQGTTYSYGRDDYGEYGSALQAETELQVPEPLDFAEKPAIFKAMNLLGSPEIERNLDDDYWERYLFSAQS